MVDLTKLKNYEKTVPFSSALTQAKKPRVNVRRKGSGNIATNYLGFDPVAGLEGATKSSNIALMKEVAKLEQKTTDMEVAGEAFRRKATNLAKQAEIRTETVQHILKEAEKLAIAQNTENTAVQEFLHRMAIANTKADHTETYSSLATMSAYTDEQSSFSQRVKNLFNTREQKAIEFEANRVASEIASAKMKAIKQQQAIIDKWQSGKASSVEALEAYQVLDSEKTSDSSIAGNLGNYVKKTLGL